MPATRLQFELVEPRVQRLLREGHRDQALALADASIRRFPRRPGAWLMLAQALVGNEQHGDAEVAVRSGLTYDANHAGLWFLLGELARQDGRLDLALHCYRRALDVDPKAPLPWARTAHVLKDQRRCAAALRACRKARIRGYSDPDELHEMARLIRRRAAGSCRHSAHARLALAAGAVLLGATGWSMAHTATAQPVTTLPTTTTTRTTRTTRTILPTTAATTHRQAGPSAAAIVGPGSRRPSGLAVTPTTLGLRPAVREPVRR